MSQVDNKSKNVGLSVSLERTDSGSYRLVVDDVESMTGVGASLWKSVGLYTTSPEYSKDELVETGLSDDQLKEIGFSIMIRLLALNGLIK